MISHTSTPKKTHSPRRRQVTVFGLLALILSAISHLPPGSTTTHISRPGLAISGASHMELSMYTLPPPFTPLLTALIGNNHLSAALFRSYARLYAAAWPYAYQCTAALDFESQVVVLLGVSRSQARQHLRLLRQSGLVNWSSDGSHRYIFRFAAPQLSIYPGPDSQPIQAHLPPGGSGQSSSRAAGQSRTQNPGQAGAHGKTDPVRRDAFTRSKAPARRIRQTRL